MRLARHTLVCLALFLPVVLIAGGPQAGQEAAAAATSARKLPVRRVVLYKNGIGFFEHLGPVAGTQALAIDFTSAQLDDVLKSLTVLDLNGGTVRAIGYNSDAPLARRLGALRLPLEADTTARAFLGALRGARVSVSRAGASAAGRLLSVERLREGSGDRVRDVDQISIVTDGGDVKLFELGPATTVRLLDDELTDRVGRYLGLVASVRDRDSRRLIIDATGQGTRQVYVSYVSEVPVWKTTYRLVLPSDARGTALLQGWAIVDNTVGEDWENVDLSLVAGAPVSFIQQLSQPFYTSRPVVPPPSSVLLAPQTHEGTLTIGSGALSGTIRDAAGLGLPGATVRLMDRAGRIVLGTTTNASGGYELRSVPAGDFTLRAELEGFQPISASVSVGAGGHATADLVMEIGALTETVNVAAAPEGVPGGVVGGIVGGLPAERPDFAKRMAAQPIAAAARDLGDLFEYKLERPVTIRQSQSALVPILRADVRAERVSLWSLDGAGGPRPLRAIWMTNTSPLTLDAGSFTLLDRNTFAGEGLTDSIKPGERRLLSYAVDLAVRVDERQAQEVERVSRMRVVNGVLISDRQQCAERTYTLRNEDTLPRTVLVEHPVREGWTLVEGTPAPAETSGSAYRFSVPVDSKKNATLIVREAHVEEVRYAVADLTEDYVTTVVARSARLGAEGAEALRTLAARKAEIRRVDRELAARAAEAKQIEADQARLRENRKALKGSAEEKQLVERYVRQLNEHEDRLASLRTASEGLRARRDQLQAALAEMVARLAFDTGTTPGSACSAR